MVIIAGLVLSLAYAPLSLWPAALVAYPLFVFALYRSKRPLMSSFIFGLTTHLIVLSWVKNYVGIPPYLALTVLQSLFSLPLGLHIKFRKPLAWLPLTFLVSEYLRSTIPFGGFGWTNPGFTQSDSPLSKLAPLGGAYLIAVLIFSLLLVRNSHQMLLILFLFVASAFINTNSAGERLSIAAVQGGEVARSDSYYRDIREVFARHFELTNKAQNVDLVIWPENVIDGGPLDSEFLPYFKKLQGRDLIVGATPMIGTMPENQSIHLSAQGEIKSTYVKNSLVPFGEYVPFRNIVDRFNSHVKEVIDFRPGKRNVIHRVDGYRLGALICFEIVDDQRVRDVALRSSALISQTNSATFIGTAQSAQQWQITRLRALEYSRPIASVSTVGITGLIDNNGRVIEQLVQNRRGILYGYLPLDSSSTPYALFPFLSLIYALFFALLGGRR